MTNLPERRHPVEDHETPLSVDERRNPSPLDRAVLAAWIGWPVIVACTVGCVFWLAS